MRTLIKILLAGALLVLPGLILSGCGCGFDCNNGNDDGDQDGPTLLTLGLSDALPEELKQVVIEVDSITLKRSGADDIVIDTFTIEDLDLTEADTFQMNLLEYRGVNQLPVFQDLEIEAGFYSEFFISILGDDVNRSFVQESDDSLKPIVVSGGGLAVSGTDLFSGEQDYVIEFGLAQSLQFLLASDTYRLTTDGVRLQNSNTSASLSGQVDRDLFDTVVPCDAKDEPEEGNRIYLYPGDGLDENTLADVFTDSSGTNPPNDAQAPFAVAALVKNSITGNWDYSFGYLPPGDYTMAFACDTETDDSVEYDNLAIPLPTDQVYEISLSEGERSECNLAVDAECS